jgi:hypothetical protein
MSVYAQYRLILDFKELIRLKQLLGMILTEYSLFNSDIFQIHLNASSNVMLSGKIIILYLSLIFEPCVLDVVEITNNMH